MNIRRKYREYTYEEYEKAMDMLREGYKPSEISTALGINKHTVKNWRNGRIPPAAKWVAKPCIELGYATGAVQGDGNVTKIELRYQHKVKLGTIDPEFAITFSRAMSRLLNKKYKEPWWNRKEREWRVEYYSKAFYIWYKRTEEQGLEGFKPSIEHNKEIVKYYLRGLFDGEGYNYRNKLIFLTNSNKKLLKYIRYLLEKYFNIKATGPYLVHKAGSTTVINGVKTILNQDCYSVQIGRKQDTQKFLEEIGFSIVRKQLGLKKHEKVFVEGIGYVEPYDLVELGLFKLPFTDNQ